jgi:cell division protein FtsL
MSASLATAPLLLPPETLLPAGRPSIEVVADRAQRRARPKVVYAGVVVASLVVLMLAQLALSIALSDGAYTIDSLETTQKQQARAEQQLSEDLGRLSSPQNLAVNAEALGMVQNANPVWLRMSDGAVIGAPAAAGGDQGVLGGAGSKVANGLLAGVPLVTQQAAADAAAASAATAPAAAAPTEQAQANAATPGQAAGGSVEAPLASEAVSGGLLPAPTTR